MLGTSAHWYFRGQPGPPSAATPGDGKTYASAWRTTADIEWSSLRPGDVLYLCGLCTRGLSVPPNLSGTAGRPITIDGSCPYGDGASDPVLWVGGVPLTFPAGWSGPDQNGLYSRPYGGSTNTAVLSSAPNSTDPSVLTRLSRGNCSKSGPLDPRAWKPGAFCDTADSQAPWGSQASQGTLFYKPLSTSPSTFFAAWSEVFVLANASHVVLRSVRVYGVGERHIRMASSSDLAVLDSHFQWAASMAITPTAVQRLLVQNNTIRQCACGLYTVGLHTAESTNDMVVRGNRFVDIDTEDFYGNGDTHAIGLQGGSRNLFEHNVVDGAGGSGITFYQGPDSASGRPPQEMHDNVVRYNTVMNIKSANPSRNQHGIETGGGRYASGNLTYNNSVYYNVLSNVTHIALRSKTPWPAATGHGRYQWRWLNNVVSDSGVGFSTAYECVGPPTEPCFKPEQVANNVFVGSRFAHHDGWDISGRTSHARNDWQNNAFYPDGPALFCFGLCRWPGQLPCANCTDFATFERDQPQPTNSLVAPPRLLDLSAPPLGMRPLPGSPLLGRGVAVGLRRDWLGAVVPTATPPAIGAFQEAAAYK